MGLETTANFSEAFSGKYLVDWECILNLIVNYTLAGTVDFLLLQIVNLSYTTLTEMEQVSKCVSCD